jgi:hypothetical protein
MTKLLIGIPTAGRPTRPFLDALAALRLPAGVDEADRLVWSGNFIAAQREMLARAAIERGADLLAMIDDDIIAPPDALELLVSALDDDPNAAIAGALYYSRDSARPMIVAQWDSRDTTSAAIPPFTSQRATVVDGVGFGCIVIRVAMLAALERPFFASHVFIDESARHVTQCDEDYLLCERFRTAGYRVLVHGGVRAGHYDRANESVAPVRWEDDSETATMRMMVRRDDGVAMVPFDDAQPRAHERHEAFPTTLLRVSP